MVENQLEAGSEAGRDRDSAVVQGSLRHWLARAALALTGAALLATSAPPQFYYSFSRTVDAPAVELTSNAPSARFLVSARATGLAPNGKPTTDQANATIAGVLTEAGAAPFVTVRVKNVNGSLAGELSVLRDFRLPRDLTFDGDCAQLTGDPCQAQFIVEFERSDGGGQDGTVGVNWSIELEARTNKESSNEGPLDLPWTLEVSRQ